MPKEHRFRGLTHKEIIFCREYIKERNGSQAAIKAGYSEKTASSCACRLLNRVHVQTEINRLLTIAEEAALISTERILSELYKLATVDIKQAFNEDGSLKGLNEMPEDVSKALSSVQIGQTRKIRIFDKIRALELLGKHLKLFDAKNELDNPLIGIQIPQWMIDLIPKPIQNPNENTGQE